MFRLKRKLFGPRGSSRRTGGGGAAAAAPPRTELGQVDGSEDVVVLCDSKDSTAVENAVRLAEEVGGRGFKVQAAAEVQ